MATIPDLDDPERRLALAYVPAARRPAVAALWALDERLARITFSAREPAIGQMRLIWWRDALDALDSAPPPAEPLLRALAEEVLPAGVSGTELAEMTAGWDALLPTDAIDGEALTLHAEQRGERLFALSSRLLGGTPPGGAGAMWAREGVARALVMRGKQPRPVPADPGAGAAGSSWPRPLRPLGMLAVLAARDPAERKGSPARILRMLRHRLTGR